MRSEFLSVNGERDGPSVVFAGDMSLSQHVWWKVTLSPQNCLYPFVNSQLSPDLWVYFWTQSRSVDPRLCLRQ